MPNNFILSSQLIDKLQNPNFFLIHIDVSLKNIPKCWDARGEMLPINVKYSPFEELPW